MRSAHLFPPLLLVLLAALVMPACDQGTGSVTLPNIPSSGIDVSVDPNPVVAVQNTLTLAATATFKIKIAEQKGLGCQVIFVNSSVFDPGTGAQVSLNYYDSADLTVFVGTNRIEALGTMTIPQSVTYALPSLGKAATLVVSVQVKDDRGNLLNRSVLATIQ